MSKSFTSPSWYRVADARPRLRSHAQIHRQRFRDQTWYVLQDHHTGQFHRISPAANHIVCLMDGRRTMQEIWEKAIQRFPEEPPTQDETIRLIYQMHAADLLHGEVAPDLAELSHRSSTQRRRNIIMRLRNPLALRFPLLDPDRFLDATVPLVRPLFGLAGLLLWLAIVLAGAALAVLHWPALTGNLGDRVLSAENLVLLLIAYPLVKAVHELGHAYAAKVWGGEVHEIGIMLLVFMPVPYVDASSSSAFKEKTRRAVVGAMGIMVEMMLAALAMMFWAAAEPGLAKAFAFNVMLIGGVSTLLFNGNPLLKFDGYYVLADLVEIPNLGTRSNKYIFYLIQRYVFGRRDATSPVTAPSERPWFVFYGISAFCYRIFISLTIAAFVATKFFFIGVLFALWALSSMFVWPVLKGARFLLVDSQMRGHRLRAWATTGAALACLAALLFVVPLPYATVIKGVVSAPHGAAVRVESQGVVARIEAAPNSLVTVGQPLFTLEDSALRAQVAVLEAQLLEQQLRLDSTLFVDRVQADMFREQVEHTKATLDRARTSLADLTIRAHADGRFVVWQPDDLPGRFAAKGALLGYILEGGDPLVRVLVPEDEVDLVRYRTNQVQVRFVGSLQRTEDATLGQEVPAAVDEILDPAFTTQGGGDVLLDPSDTEKRRPLERHFQFDVIVAAPDQARVLGRHAYVRFTHDAEPVAVRVSRVLRQLFLSQFDV